MQEHFGQSMNLARIKLMALLLHALCVVQTVSPQLADAMPTACVDKEFHLRRLQKDSLPSMYLTLDIMARMIFSLLPVKTGLVLSMDRTTGSSGSSISTFFMLGITYKEGSCLPFDIQPSSRNVATPTGKNARRLWNVLSVFSERNASTALWQTASSSERNGQDGSTAIAYGITSEYTSEFLDCQAFHR